MTLIPQPLACFSPHSQDTVQNTGLAEPSLPACRHTLPLTGARYRSDAYRLAVQPAQPAVCCNLPAVSVAEYKKVQQRQIQQRLQRRLAAAEAQGNQSLVRLLQGEMQQAS